MKLFRKLNSPVTTSIGMFDLLKGIILLVVVYHHNRNLFPTEILDISTIHSGKPILNITPIILEIIKLFSLVVGPALMKALFILAGFSYRKRTILKGFILEIEELIKPYLLTAIVTVILHFIMHYCFFRYIPSALIESLKLLGGMLLGFDQTNYFAGSTFFANGPIWFLLSLFWSLVIFNILLNKVDETKLKYYVLGISIIGWLLSYLGIMPFCLSPGLIGVLYVYIGYYIRKNKVLTSEHSMKSICIYIFLVITPFTVQASIKFSKLGEFCLGYFPNIKYALVGIGLVYVFLRINRVVNGKISNALRYLGRYSLYFMCIHTVEMIAIPWYAVVEKLTNHLLIGLIITSLFRISTIVLALIILNKYKSYMCRKMVQ